MVPRPSLNKFPTVNNSFIASVQILSLQYNFPASVPTWSPYRAHISTRNLCKAHTGPINNSLIASFQFLSLQYNFRASVPTWTHVSIWNVCGVHYTGPKICPCKSWRGSVQSCSSRLRSKDHTGVCTRK